MILKERIINTATDLFLNFGFKSVTMDHIAEEMGISKKTIYANFSTKTKLVEATTLNVLVQIADGIDAIRKEKKDPITELFEIKRFTSNLLKGEKTSPQFQLEKYYPEISAKIHKYQTEIIENCIKDNLERGIKKEYYRPSLPVDFINKIYFTGIMGIKNASVFPPEKYNMEELLEKYLEYHLRAIVTSKGLNVLKEHITIED
jgi:AcrR family transcriptional regulator